MKDFNENIKKVVASINSAPPEQYTFVCESTPKHDGKLDERGDCMVDYSPKSKAGTYIRVLMHDDGAILTPKQALFLLAWLRQEETTLEQLAKEQQ